jgi:hypothetical protein
LFASAAAGIAVVAVPADAGALGFHPFSDTRAEVVNCSIKQAKLALSTSLFHLPNGTLAYFFDETHLPANDIQIRAVASKTRSAPFRKRSTIFCLRSLT